MTSKVVEGMVLLLLVVIYAAIMFIPTFVAFHRRHDHRMIILVINAFLGWTGIGWAGTMIWALTEEAAGAAHTRAAAQAAE